MAKIFLTTAIDYTNAVIHVGHAYQKILTDCLARFYRSYGHQTYFLTGTDEYGTTNEKAAKAAGKDPYNYVREVSEKDREQLASLHVSYDRFIETTDEDHHQTVLEFYTKVYKNGDIYKGTYEGLYCEGCEAYKTLTELVEGKCPLHMTREIVKINEENYFFKWSKYRDFLVEYISQHEAFVIPENRKAEMLAFLKNGLEDLPISRPKYKVSWGIPVPGDPEQVIYVWFDALINYYTAGYKEGYWDEDTRIIHVLGKDNARWHVLLWPAMLKSAGLRLPDNVLTHGFINLNGQKISKSLGNIIRPIEIVEQYGADAVRYFFLKYGPEKEDVDISHEKIKHVYNSELANDWGNLVSRVAKLCETNSIPGEQEEVHFYDYVIKAFEHLSIAEALHKIHEEISKTNAYLNEEKPWDAKSSNKQEVLKTAVKRIRAIAHNLTPFMPVSSKHILDQFSDKVIASRAPYFSRLK